jgi:hypothetical protein
MTDPAFTVTYSIVTAESAEVGDVADAGFVDAGEWRSAEPVQLRFAEAIALVGCLHDIGNGSFYEVDFRLDRHTGEYERRTLHCSRATTESSLARIRRVLRAYRSLTDWELGE